LTILSASKLETKMATISGIVLAVLSSVYVIQAVSIREYRVRLCWPALTSLALLFLLLFLSIFGAKLFPESESVTILSSYPELFVVLGCLLAFGLGRLAKRRPWLVYRPTGSEE
jgi:hypothetical protein